MENNIQRWLEADGEISLKKIGIKKDDIVLDFGCGVGNHTIPAAKIAGENGKVYALDKDKEVLNNVLPKAEIYGLNNIEIMKTAGELEVNLGDASVDVVLLYDVLHSPRASLGADDRKELLNEVHRILKPDGFLSVYPMHADLKEVKEEIESSSFYLENEYFGTLLLYTGKLRNDQILNFKRKQA
ncbi:class I SAM-dependent methyltransferase [Chloroflexota bacterium]